jgi:hypothetical protein
VELLALDLGPKDLAGSTGPGFGHDHEQFFAGINAIEEAFTRTFNSAQGVRLMAEFFRARVHEECSVRDKSRQGCYSILCG